MAARFKHIYENRTHKITWESPTLAPELVARFSKYVTDTPIFQLTPEFTAMLVKRFGMPENVVISLFQVVVKDKNYSSGMRKLIIQKAAALYKTTDISQLSKQYNIAPLIILKEAFHLRGMSHTQINNVIAKKCHYADVLVGRDIDQFLSAESADLENYTNTIIRAQIGQKNEDAIANFLHSLGITFKSQAMLVEEQHLEFGRAVATPDILFTCNVEINGVPTKWLEYKDYTGTTHPLFYRKNVVQGRRYNELFGDGVFVFNHMHETGLAVFKSRVFNTAGLNIDLL